jgi:NADH:ubiquinone oxidoreductase subunit C
MSTVGWLPAPAEDLFGTQATAEESYEVLTVDVPPETWLEALRVARDQLGCTYFDWLSAVDEPGTGFRVFAHVVALSPVRRLLLRTTVAHEAPTLASAVDVYAGAAWHERETHEMFGVVFEGHPALDHLLLPETFEGHPLRKDFVLAARVAKAWPGAKEPGESDHGAPKRRQILPPGVPDPNEWGPLKGQLPPAPPRPARAAGRTAGDGPARAAGDRPVRRARSAAEGSASQASGEAAGGPRRARSAAEGSASQTPGEGTAGRRARSAAEGSASQAASAPAEGAAAGPAAAEGAPPAATDPSDRRHGAAGGAAAPRRARTAGEGSASQRARTPEPQGPTAEPATAARSADAPWHHARPAFDEPEPQPVVPAEEPTSEEPTSEEPTSEEPTSDDPPSEKSPRTTPEHSSAEPPPANPDKPAGGPQ